MTSGPPKTAIIKLSVMAPGFLCWLMVYFSWSSVDMVHHVWGNSGVSHGTNHLFLFWVYWVVADVLLWCTIVFYLKPRNYECIAKKKGDEAFAFASGFLSNQGSSYLSSVESIRIPVHRCSDDMIPIASRLA